MGSGPVANSRLSSFVVMQGKKGGAGAEGGVVHEPHGRRMFDDVYLI